MKRLKITLFLALSLLLLLTVSALAEEAENLTESCTVKVVDKTGKVKSITDGKYTTFWESSKRNGPWVTLSSEKPIYGLYLCFRNLPESYVIQKMSGDDWVTVAEGSAGLYHAFYELEGLKKIRILSTAEKKNVLGFNEIYAFGEGSVPDWVQRWQPPVEKADLLFLIAHPDDELLFTGGAIPTYGAERGGQVQVVYLTPSNPTRRSEALNGLWHMGVRNYPVFGNFSDRYAKSGKLKDAYKLINGGQNTVWSWVTEQYRRFRPEVVVTQDLNGEYGHPQHKMVADAAIQCYSKAADPSEFKESAEKYGTWQVKKLYIHLYGEEGTQTILDWDQPLTAFGGKTGAELAAEAFALHVSQKGMGAGKGKKFEEFKVETTGAKKYPYDHFGLHSTEVGQDEAKDDFLEHLDSAVQPTGEQETGPEEKPANSLSDDPDETVTEEETETETEETEETPEEEAEEVSGEEDEEEPAEETENETEAAEETGKESAGEAADGETAKASEKKNDTIPMTRFQNVTAPEWADVELNTQGFLDEGEYVYADDENGHYLYVSPTLRVVIKRTIVEQKKAKHFYCFTAHIWCDIPAGELPTTVFRDPEKKKSVKDFVRNIAMDNKVVFATTTDYYIYRIKASYPTGIEVRNGEVIIDDPHKLMYSKGSMPTYETLALYRDGHAESLANKDKSGPQYVEEGAYQVYSFGPCLVKEGKLTEYAEKLCNTSYNPRLAIGVAEDGHYIVMLCEGRVKRSGGVQMATLAQLMLEQGCTLAVNMDGGQSAVLTFMGHQLNQVVKSDPNGREQADILAFGFSDQVGTFEMADEFKSKKK